MNFTKISILMIMIAPFLGCQVVRIGTAPSKVSLKQIPFERNNPNAELKILFLGDSTAVGTGAQSNTESVAGWFGQNFPNAHIRNISLNGERLTGLLEKFPPLNISYDLAILQIGGNDIIHFTRLNTIDKNISLAIDRAKMIADHVVIMHSGDVGLAPIFFWPLNRLYTSRTRAVRNIYIKRAEEKNVVYIDLFEERKDDIFLKDINKFYSPDHLHPSGQGYHVWYEQIRKTLDENNIKLTQ